MLREAEDHSSSGYFPEKLYVGIQTLHEAFDYAQDVAVDPWEFAVEKNQLHALGLSESDLRWLVLKGMIEHASEVTVHGDNGRQFRPTGNLTFCERSCVILTEAGALFACSIASDDRSHREIVKQSVTLQPITRSVPEWDAESRRLFLNGILVKWFKWRAANQEAILNAFQEEHWPSRIDDPLSPQPEQDAKRRLSDTIKCLNHKQSNGLLRFHGDGTGEGVVWEQL